MQKVFVFPGDLESFVVEEVFVVSRLHLGHETPADCLVIPLCSVNVLAGDLAAEFQLARIRDLLADTDAAITGGIAFLHTEGSKVSIPSDGDHRIGEALRLRDFVLLSVDGMQRALHSGILG